MLVTKSWIETNYNKFNKLYWNNELPEIEFKISRAKHTWGYASYKYDFVKNTIYPTEITMSNYYDSPEEVKLQTLLHEMIHIADYTFHPEHFIRNGKKVRKNYYDAHGYWFRKEADRIEKMFGHKIAEHVTREEFGKSCLSERSAELLENKKNIARLLVASNGTYYWMFKTDEYKINNVVKLIKRWIPEYNKITIYSFDNEHMAARRSCNTKLSGWKMMKNTLMMNLEKYKATTLKSYKI